MRSRIASVLVAVALVVAACADDAADDAGQAAQTTVATTTTAPPAATASPTTTIPPTTTAAAPTTVAPSPEAAVDYAEPGPWAVGVTTIDLGDRLAEVYYPVDRSDVGDAEKETYTQLEPFPDAIRELLAGLDTEVVIDAYRDLPASDDGPFPVVQYSHGFGGFRKIATFHLVHLASWGFVTTTTDHLERGILAVNGFIDVEPDDDADTRDLIATLDAIERASAEAGVLSGSVDTTEVAVAGHSAGGFAAVAASIADDRYDAVISWASGGGDEQAAALSVPILFAVADRDMTVAPEASRTFHDAVSAPKRWLLLENAGHNSFTDACVGIYDRGGLADIAETLQLPPEQVERGEEGCVEGYTRPEAVFDVLNHVGLAFVLETFGLADVGDALEPDTVEALFPEAVETFEATPE